MTLNPIRLHPSVFLFSILSLTLGVIDPTWSASKKETGKKDPGAKPETQIYELEFETNSDWTSIEIRDDAVFVNAPAAASMNITAKDGLRSFTISPKKIHLRSKTRGQVNLNLFIKSRNNVLGITLCKGSSQSYSWIRSEQSRQKNDIKKKDHCEPAALVLNLF